MSENHGWLQWAFLALLIVSLAFNIVTMNRIAALGQRLTGDVRQANQAANMALSEVRSLNDSLARLRQQQAWYSPPKFELLGGDSACDHANARLTWTFHDLAEDATVSLDYRLDNGEWQSATVINVDGTTYEADLQIPVQPNSGAFSVSYLTANGNTADARSSSATTSSGPNALEYVIHANENGKLRSGGTEQLGDVGKLSGYYAISINRSSQGREYQLTLYQRDTGLDCVMVKQVAVLVNTQSGSTEEVMLDEQVSGPEKAKWQKAVQFDSGVTVNTFTFKLTFEDGSTLEKEVPGE